MSERTPGIQLLDAIYRTVLFLPEQGSTQAESIDHLHFFEITVMTLLAMAVAAAAAWFIWRYRRRAGNLRTERVVAPRWLEVCTYSGILAFFLLLWGIGIRQYVDMGRAPDGALEVYVTAKQWMWKFGYPEGVGSVGVLYVPAGRPVRLVITSRDVIHSFYVPDFRLKRDAVPGMYTGIWFEADEPGVHQVLCAEMCGTGHSQMRGEVVVLAPDAFDAWMEQRAQAPEAGATGATRLAELGEEAAARHGCFQCHSIDGRRLTGPTWKDVYGSQVELRDGSRVRVDEAYITESMMDPRAKVVAGYEPLMPSFQGQISAEETAAIVELIKSLREEPGALEGGKR